MKRSEAPPPGWYPDPTGRSGLLWWDGLDWTAHHRPPPVAGSEEEARSSADRSGTEEEHDAQGAVPSANQLRSRASTGRRRHRSGEREIADAAAEARRVAKSEVDRAVQQATAELTRAREQWQPRLAQYVRRAKRWLRIVAVAVVLLVALSTWASATMQTSLLEWLGDRIDAVTGAAVAGSPTPPVS